MEWRTSTYSSDDGNCVEVAPGVHVRDSKNPDGGMLTFPHAQWAAFTSAVKIDQFD